MAQSLHHPVKLWKRQVWRENATEQGLTASPSAATSWVSSSLEQSVIQNQDLENSSSPQSVQAHDLSHYQEVLRIAGDE